MASGSRQSLSSSPASVSPSSPPASGNSAGESYIGSFVSLISKFEIRYEGVLYYLNPDDSALGLNNVRSYGTEGRKKDGPQIPPSDKVYEYILFRGNDIKDLQVKAPPTAQSTQEIPSGLDINQSLYSQPAVISSLPGSYSSCSLVKSTEWMDTPAVCSKPFPASQHLLPPLSSSPSSADVRSLTEPPQPLIGPSSNFQAAQNDFVSSIPLPSGMQGNTAAPTGGYLPMMHQPVSSPSLMHNQSHITDSDSSPIMGIVNDTSQESHLVTRAFDHPAYPPYFSSSPLDQPRLSSPNSLSSFPASIHGSQPTGSEFVGKVPYDSAFSQPIPYELPGVTPNLSPVNPSPLFSSPHSFLRTEQLLQSREQSLSSRSIVSGCGDMVAATKPISVDVLSQSMATVVQEPLLSLPVSAQQSQKPSSSIQFTEEFDFEAMNEKFKKDEVWGFLGKNKLGVQTNDREAIAMKPSLDGKTKPAYNKDDFFDTISRNTLNRASRGGHSHFSGRMRQDTETFGNFQHGPQLQPGDGGYLTAHANYRGGYNSGTGYGYYGGRGHVRNTHF